MRWFYFYTPDYAFWHQHLSSTLGEHFELRPIQVASDELPVHEGGGRHHFTGVRRKLELVLACVEQNRGRTILFSDCTQIIHGERVDALRAYLESPRWDAYDLVFASNAIDPTVNIGFLRIRCRPRTARFWSRCLRGMHGSAWDQQVVNDALRRNRWRRFGRVRWTRFDESRIVCGYRLDPAYRSRFLTYKQFIHPSNRDTNWNSRLQSLHGLGLISDGQLRNHVRPA